MCERKSILIISFFLFLLGGLTGVGVGAYAETATPTPTSGTTLILQLGQSTTVPAGPSATIRVGRGRIISAVDGGRAIRVFGRNVGSATLLVDSRLYTVHVLTKQSMCLREHLSKILPAMMGLQADVKDGQVTVTGTFHRASDWRKILAEAQTCDSAFQNLARVDEDIQQDILQDLKARLKRQATPDLQCRFSPTLICLSPPQEKKESEATTHILEKMGVEVRIDPNRLQTEPLVRLQVMFVEVTKSEQQELGLTWPTSAEFQVSPKWKSPQDLRATLNAMESHGQGQVLASPTLICRSGGEAEFLAGGEFPYRIRHHKTVEVAWKRHGIFLKFKPLADKSGNMKIEMTSEVSFPESSAQSIDSPPGLKTNRITSQFDLKKSQTLIISGLVKNLWGAQAEGLTGLQNIPVLGRLFRSDSFTSNKSELLLFVTPEVVPDDAH